MNRFYFLAFLLFICFSEMFGQTISGKVIHAEDKSPIIHANVFLQGSQIGTITDVDGCFQLDLKGNAVLPLVISSIGFNTVVLNVNKTTDNLEVALKEKSYEINDINIRSEKCSWSREKMVKIFFREFVGKTRCAKSCVIENIDDIYLFYNDKTKILHANCKEPIVIRNSMLGYYIYFTLENFEWTKKIVRYNGYTKFEELIVSEPEETERIQFRRKVAYKGTPMYFFRNLYQDNLAKADFRLSNWDGESVKLEDIVLNYGPKKYLSFDYRVFIYYGLDKLESSLLLSKSLAEVHSNGYVNPEEFEVTGYLSLFRVGDRLPYDYYDRE